MNISVLVGLKNNLEYTKLFHRLFRRLYPEVELCFVSYGSTDGTHEWLSSHKDPYLRTYSSDESKTFSDTYNKCVEISTKDNVVFLHNDIVVCEGFLENIHKHLQVDTVVSYTTIEPPIFNDHQRPGKIIRDFGYDFWNYKPGPLDTFVKEQQSLNENSTTPGITFFMALSKSLFNTLEGFDNLFNPMFCEDDDFIRRLNLLGVTQITSLDALCYHFVSKTSRFSPEFKDTTEIIEQRSNINFMRKWRSFPHYKNSNIYDIALIIENCKEEVIGSFEPFFSTLYVDCDIEPYIVKHQPYTKFDLRKRVKRIEEFNYNHDMDIRLNLDSRDFKESGTLLQNIAAIIDKTGEVEPGTYGLHGNILLHIKEFRTFTKELITLNSIYYKNKLL